MLIFAIITVFIAGLMVGRTPEYLGKKIEAREMKLSVLAVIAPSFAILTFTALAVTLPVGLSSRANAGPHGFTEILYAFTSTPANNGSAFAGLNGNTPFYDLMMSLAMLIGRFGVLVPAIAVGGGMAMKKAVPESPGTFRTDTATFVVLLVAVVVIVAGLNFFPALTLGPIVEHFLALRGMVF
jgi:potassium-transporting ATPase potassium-binding subunit